MTRKRFVKGLAMAAGVMMAAHALAQSDIQAQGKTLLDQMLEANRCWLTMPPDDVKSYQFTFHGTGPDPQTYTITNPRKTSSSRRQGITYWSLLQCLAAGQTRATVRDMEQAGETVRLTVGLSPAVKGDCGNGIENRWHGYFNLGGDWAEIRIDAKRKVPLRVTIGRLTETFDEFVEIVPGRYVPLKIVLDAGDSMQFEWGFRV